MCVASLETQLYGEMNDEMSASGSGCEAESAVALVLVSSARLFDQLFLVIVFTKVRAMERRFVVVGLV